VGVSGTFIDGGAGRILVVSHEPDRPTDRAVLVVPAFAEEMNKSRRLVWDTARVLREHGIRTLVPDLFGTGDSEGDFAQARWDIWVDDLCRTIEWARERGAARFGALVVRFGMALFAAANERMSTEFERAVAWQPVVNGADVLRQLLRMKVMSIRMLGGRAESADALLETLLNGGEPMELGGYLVSCELARAVHGTSAAPAEIAVKAGVVLEFDATSSAEPDAPEARARDPGTWRVERIAAERFWAAFEPRPNPALASSTATFLSATT
jgi:exosortase A-associated hydrolase 2